MVVGYSRDTVGKDRRVKGRWSAVGVSVCLSVCLCVYLCVCLSICLNSKFGQFFCASFLESGVREADEQQKTMFGPTFYVLYYQF